MKLVLLQMEAIQHVPKEILLIDRSIDIYINTVHSVNRISGDRDCFNEAEYSQNKPFKGKAL